MSEAEEHEMYMGPLQKEILQENTSDDKCRTCIDACSLTGQPEGAHNIFLQMCWMVSNSQSLFLI